MGNKIGTDGPGTALPFGPVEHTPGPWLQADRVVVVVPETHGYGTWIAAFNVGGADLREQVANARLTAAAPELLFYSTRLLRLMDAAGLMNLARGVELGAASWLGKTTDAVAALRLVCKEATVGKGGPTGQDAQAAVSSNPGPSISSQGGV